MPQFLDAMRQVINDPAVEILPNSVSARPGSPPSKLDTDAFRAVEAAIKRTYNTVTLPTMLTGATDMSYLRSRGV